MSDDRLGAQPVVLLSDGFWHRHFGGDPAVIGKALDMDGADYTIAGILPPGFSFYETDRDVFVPIGQWDNPSFRDRRLDLSSHAVGRLMPGVTPSQASAEMDSIAEDLAVAYPEADKGVGVSRNSDGRRSRRQCAAGPADAARRCRVSAADCVHKCRQLVACAFDPPFR